MLACNNIMGFDGEMLDDYSNLRKSKPAHLSINMWVLNIFAEKDKPDTLVRSIDIGHLDLKFR